MNRKKLSFSNFVEIAKLREINNERAHVLFDKIDFKVGETLTDDELVDRLCKLRNVSRYKAKTLEEKLAGMDDAIPDEIISDCHCIRDSLDVEVTILYKRKR